MGGPIDHKALSQIQAITKVHGDTVGGLVDAAAQAIAERAGNRGGMYTHNQLLLAMDRYLGGVSGY